ncbi:unnamed protein product [Allacma fusca]|uniref:Uncharacterized protein n=1 Tax=Allacma fusca TaxID=39272 RepID=A0A8J2K3H4_9HEXA|nr:unnamed protein product [Allacma fusca]
MPQKLLPLVLSLVLVGIGGNPEGNVGLDVSVNDIVLELDYIDQSLFGWEAEWLWFEKVNSTAEIQAIIDRNSWYSHITFKKWAELNPVSVGLWVLFYQELPPAFGIEPPFIGNKGSFGTKNQHNLFITYFMYGSCSMEIYAEDAFIRTIENPCGKSCSFDFHTVRVPFNGDPYQDGKYRFRINFSTTRPGDFLIIDMIQVDNIQLTTPTPCDCKPCYQVLDNNSEESLEGWNVTDNLLEHFHDMQDIEDNLGGVLPPEFDYSGFEGAEGIWVAFNDEEVNSELPAFEYVDDEFDYVEITSYLHNDSSLFIYIGDSSEPEILFNEEEELKWSIFRVDLDGAEKFRVEVNLTDEGYFAFVDKIVARRSACPIPESDAGTNNF